MADTCVEILFLGQRLTKDQLVALVGDGNKEKYGYWYEAANDDGVYLPQDRLDKRLVSKDGDYQGCAIVDAVVLDPEFPDVVLFGCHPEPSDGEFPYFVGILAEASASRWHANDCGRYVAETWPESSQLSTALAKFGIAAEPTNKPRRVSGYAVGLA